MKYYSKEALFQYQDEKHLNLWLEEAKRLEEQSNMKDLPPYIILIENFRVNVVKIKEIQKTERALFTSLKSIRLQN